MPERDALDFIERVVALDPEMEIASGRHHGQRQPGPGAAGVRACPQGLGPRALAFHGHDTYGMGVANVTAAWEPAADLRRRLGRHRRLSLRAGVRLATWRWRMSVWLFRRMGVETGVGLAKLLVAADMAAAVPGVTPGGAMRRVPAARLAAEPEPFPLDIRLLVI